MEIENLNLKLFLWYLHNKLIYLWKFRLILSHYWKLNRWHLEQKQSPYFFTSKKSNEHIKPNRGKINSHFSYTSDSSQLYFSLSACSLRGSVSIFFARNRLIGQSIHGKQYYYIYSKNTVEISYTLQQKVLRVESLITPQAHPQSTESLLITPHSDHSIHTESLIIPHSRLVRTKHDVLQHSSQTKSKRFKRPAKQMLVMA